MAGSLYDILGVAENASEEAILAAYRSRALTCHPDLNPGDPEAESRFRYLAAAMDILGDPEQRRLYDMGEIGGEDMLDAPQRPSEHFYRTHARGPEGEKYTLDPHTDTHRLNDSREKAADVTYSIIVDFLDAARGMSRTATLPDGKRVEITVPAGIDDGHVIRLKGQGEHDPRRRTPGDLLLRVSIEPHPVFSRQGNDILIDLPLTVAEAMFGTQLRIPTIHGPVSARVPAATDAGTTLRLKGKGVHPVAGEPGDQIVKVRIVLPRKVNEKFAAAVNHWHHSARNNPRGAWEALL